MHAQVATLCSDWSLLDSGSGTNTALRMLTDPSVPYVVGVATRLMADCYCYVPRPCYAGRPCYIGRPAEQWPYLVMDDCYC